jgi:hypothetical protein
MRFLACGTFLLALIACERSTIARGHEIDLLRAKLRATHDRFAAVAIPLSKGSIVWADSNSVRYQSNQREFVTESWGRSALAPQLSAEIRSFISANGLRAIFVTKERVNFGLVGEGLGISGASVGLLIAINGEHGCTSIVPVIVPTGNGTQCERLAENTFFYLQR